MLIKRCILLASALIVGCFWASHSRPLAAAVRTKGPAGSVALTNSDCLACHGDPNLRKEVNGQSISLQVDADRYSNSAHGSLDCISCHTAIKQIPHDPVSEKVDCSQCHADASQAYSVSVHAQAIQRGNPRAAACTDCHGSAHEVLPSSDPKSKVNHANIAATCGACHGVKFIMEASGITTSPFISYQESVHGRAVASGNEKAATCTDCHGNHAIRAPSDPQSSIFKFNVAKTCGQCHQDVASDFGKSVHGQALSGGNDQAPACTDCHGIHLIKSHIDPTSSVAAQALARTTCGRCHQGLRLTQEYGIPSNRLSSYLDSYHGLASQLGSTVVANCASCHGVHNILPSSDPNSTVNPRNLAATCGKCHPGASGNILRGKVHLEVAGSEDIGSKATRWVRLIYLPLIGLVLGGMLLHNALIWRKKLSLIRRSRPRDIVRLTRKQVVQHWLLIISFAGLAVTGFALKYPDSWLATLLGSNESLRRSIHRIAAVVILTVGLYHIAYANLTKEGRQGLRDIFPRREDLADAWQNVVYAIGLSSRKPEFGRFSYAEKIEYWALIWGTVIMGLTGLIIWFQFGLFSFLPRWCVNVALAVHFYEAILATLAVLIWHFYQVIFDPDVYPLNWAVLDGRISHELYREEHGLAYREMMEREQNKTTAEPEASNSTPGEPRRDDS